MPTASATVPRASAIVVAGGDASSTAIAGLPHGRLHQHQQHGRSISIKAGDDSTIVYGALVEKVGLSPSQARETAVATPLAALLRREIDVWVSTILPAARDLERSGARYRVIKPASYGVHVPGTVYVASESMVRENPEVLERVLCAIVGGWERVYADYDKSIPIIAGFAEPPLAADLVRFDLDIQRDFLEESIFAPFGKK